MKNIMKSGMASVLVIIIATIAVVIFTSSGLLKERTNHPEKSFSIAPGDPLPKEVNAVISSSCINCHGAGGKALAMSKLNLSEWDQYDHQKQVKKAAAMCKMLSKGAMPPKSYIRDHPDAVPTQEQKDLVCKWAQSLKSGK